jgi:polygalacturonase
MAVMLCMLLAHAQAWKSVSVEDYGALGDNSTDNTKAFRDALLAVAGGGEVGFIS